MADASGGRRNAWALADQAISSGTNFAVGLLLARALGATSYGRYAIAVAAWLFLLGVVRTLLVQPYVVDSPTRSMVGWRDETAHVAGAAVLAGLGGSLVALVTAGLLGSASPSQGVLVGLALVLPALVLQDTWRFVAFAAGRARTAAVNDGCWAVAQTVFLGLLWVGGALSPTTAVVGWGCGAACAALAGVVQFSVRPRIARSTLAWIRGAARTGGWFTMSNLIHGAGTQGLVFLVAGFAGPAAVGGLRASTTLFAPVQLVTMASESVGLPEAAAARARGRTVLRDVCTRYSLRLVGFAGVYAGMQLSVGHHLLPAVFGPSFGAYTDLIPALAVVSLSAAVSTGPALVLRALRRGTWLTIAQATSMSLTLVAAALLTGPLGVSGAALSLAGGSVLQAALLWVAYGRATRAGSTDVVRSNVPVHDARGVTTSG